MHQTNYRKSIRLTFLTTTLMTKGGEKVIFFWIIHCNKEKFYK